MKILDEIHGSIVLSNEEIESELNNIGWTKVIDAISETFIEEAHGRVISPPKTIINFTECNNDFRMMPSYMEKYPDFCGTKIISACSDNPKKYGLPTAMGIYILNDKRTQKSLMIFDAAITTAWRTAAASAVGVRELSYPDSKVLGIIGCGRQAHYHIPAILSIRKDIDEILINDLNEDNMEKLMDAMDKYNIKKASKVDILNTSDILVTMTPTTKAHILTKDVPNRNMMICAIGGDSEIKMEFEPTILKKVNYFCDSLDQVSHTGTVYNALKESIITKKNLKPLGGLMIGKEKLNKKKVKMFLSTGVALEDLAIAILLYNKVKNKT